MKWLAAAALCAVMQLSSEAQEANTAPNSRHMSGRGLTSGAGRGPVVAPPSILVAAPPVIAASTVAAPEALPKQQPAILAAGVAPAALPASAAPKFSPLVVADLLDQVCRAAEADRKGVIAAASSSGLAASPEMPAGLGRTLPDSARIWAVPAREASVYLFGYGEELLRCGAAILRPLPNVTAQRVIEQLGKPPLGFTTEKTETLSGTVQFTRLKSAAGRFIDLMEYSADGGEPGVLRLDLLPAD